ncbi:uncharacterized protein [Rutidosis leptorrhynchoides]|uniref:uncharacterized protein n=1 Tax=Rutidosis leptorrhynchoides TaxID=125765 RepID=UPI003A98DE3E
MESCIKISPSINLSVHAPSRNIIRKLYCFGDKTTKQGSFLKIKANSDNGAANSSASQLSATSAVGDMHRKLSSLESLFCYDKAVPEEIIEEPVGLSLGEKNIGNKTRCPGCEAKGAILCATCSGSGLYVDSILESQGIIVKVRCLGCGGTGNIMCSECGGRGHSVVA